MQFGSLRERIIQWQELLFRFKSLSVLECRCDLGWGENPGGPIQRPQVFFIWKEMRILRTLGSDNVKLQPFPDEWLDSNPVCSTGVNSYPSASNIQRIAPEFWWDDWLQSSFHTNLFFSLLFLFFFFQKKGVRVPSSCHTQVLVSRHYKNLDTHLALLRKMKPVDHGWVVLWDKMLPAVL